jgi:hypothetical protein
MWVCGKAGGGGGGSDEIGIKWIGRNDTIRVTGRIHDHKYGAILCNQAAGEEHI